MGSLKEDHLHLHEKTNIDKKDHGGHAGGGNGSHTGDKGHGGAKGGHGGGSHGAGGGHIGHDHGKGKWTSEIDKDRKSRCFKQLFKIKTRSE